MKNNNASVKVSEQQENKQNKQNKQTKQPKQTKTQKAQPKAPQKTPPKADNKPVVRIIPLGGLDQIGRNMTVIETRQDIVIVDCGQAFPGEDTPGVDSVICNFSYLRDHFEKIRGVALTHGHEDHIGAIAYFLKEFNVPVYGTGLTLALVENKLEEANIKNRTLNHVKAGDKVVMGNISVEFLRTNHSISDACALAIYTEAGVLVHTGDFKVDYTPISGDPINLSRFSELGRHGVLALMSDSTNAERAGYTMSERTVGAKFNETFKNAPGRILVATFASNVDRVQQILTAAALSKRKVLVTGRSMESVVETALRLGYLKDPSNVLIDEDQLKKYDDQELVIITTGSQGEPMAALSRMASGMHKIIRIKDGDTVVFSSKPVPGNEKTVNNIINELMKQNATVISEDAHVSGHASQEELKLIYSLLKPKYFLPVHGEVRHLSSHARLIEGLGHDAKKIWILKNGDCLELNSKTARITNEEIPVDPVLVDGLSVGDVGNEVLNDRRDLAENGLFVVVVGIGTESHRVLAGPDFITKGFVFVRHSEVLLAECKELITDLLKDYREVYPWEYNVLRNAIRDKLRTLLQSELGRKPILLPYILEIPEK